MKKLRIMTLLIVSIILYACPKEKGNSYITIVNKSERKIVCQPFYANVNTLKNQDTLYLCGYGADGIRPDTLYLYDCGRCRDWETDFKGISFIQFLIMDDEIYGNYIKTPCDTIRKYVPILHCYRLTLGDLQRMNWTVVYPPEE